MPIIQYRRKGMRLSIQVYIIVNALEEHSACHLMHNIQNTFSRGASLKQNTFNPVRTVAAQAHWRAAMPPLGTGQSARRRRATVVPGPPEVRSPRSRRAERAQAASPPDAWPAKTSRTGATSTRRPPSGEHTYKYKHIRIFGTPPLGRYSCTL